MTAMRAVLFLLVTAAVAGFTACGQDDEAASVVAPAPDAEVATDAATGSDATAPPPDAAVDASVDASLEAAVDAGLCNDLVNAAPKVALQHKVGVTPATTGGAIVPGTYVLTEEVRWFATVAPPVSGIAGPQQVTTRYGATTREWANGNRRGTTSYTTSGATLLETSMCPANVAGASTQYTATPTEIVIVAGDFSQTYTKL